MALRLNVYGWNFETFTKLLGSGDLSLLEVVTKDISGRVRDELVRQRSIAFARTLLVTGLPLRSSRPPQSGPADGGLLTTQLEVESHVIAIECLRKAIARPTDLDLSLASSNWYHSAIGALYRDAAACQFTRSRECPLSFHRYLSELGNGRPLFADSFHSDWSFYTYALRSELPDLIAGLKAAAAYERKVPPNLPQPPVISLSESGKKLATELTGWFDQICMAGQDLFVLWY